MPKKFSDQERDWIRLKLLAEAKRQFELSGLRKTSVETLTKAAGIAQGSFYMFFGSKEELYYELLLQEEQRIRTRVLESHPPDQNHSRDSIRSFLMDALRLMDDSPLLRQMMERGEMELLLRKLPPALLERNELEDRDALLPVITAWRNAGIMPNTPPETIVGMIRALALLALHKQEIGESQYSATLELLVDVLSAGMLSVSEQAKGGEVHD